MREVLVFVLELLAHILTPGVQERLADAACRLLPDLPHLTGAWDLHFQDPSQEGSVAVVVYASMKQFGRKIRGSGHIHGFPEDCFRFEGRLKRNVFSGSYARNSDHVLAGTGTFVLKVRADSKTMSGQCLWYDGLLDEVWSSKYRWERRR